MQHNKSIKGKHRRNGNKCNNPATKTKTHKRIPLTTTNRLFCIAAIDGRSYSLLFLAFYVYMAYQETPSAPLTHTHTHITARQQTLRMLAKSNVNFCEPFYCHSFRNPNQPMALQQRLFLNAT